MADDVAQLVAALMKVRVLAETNPAAAADLLDLLADEFRDAATKMRREKLDTLSRGGFGDKVEVNVIGPDGSVKATGGTN